LSWILEQITTEDGTYQVIGTGRVPSSSTNITKILKDNILVPTSTTYHYKLTITLNNLELNQSSDINASMHSKFNLEVGTKPLTAVKTLQRMVAGASTSSTDIITGTPPDGYQEFLNKKSNEIIIITLRFFNNV